MTKTNIPITEVEELIEQIKAEVSRRKDKGETGNTPAHQMARDSQTLSSHEIDLFDTALFPEPEPFELKEDGYHINDFLKYHDQYFVMNAYRGILKRRPDSEGIRHFLESIRSGHMSKAEIIGRLRYSPEGRLKKVKIKGLFWKFVIQSSFRVPVLGYFSRLTVGIVNLPVILRNLNALENNTFTQLQSQQNQITTFANKVKFKINELIEKQGQVEPKLDQKADREDLAVLIEQKVNREELMEINKAKADVKDLIAFDEKKADRDELAALNKEKASREELAKLIEVKADAKDLAILDKKKANRDELEVLNEQKVNREELMEINEAKADVKDLMALDEKKAARRELIQLKEEFEEALERKTDEDKVEFIKNEIKKITHQIRDNKLSIIDQQRRLALLLEEARKRLPEPISTDQIKKILTEEDHLLDSMYVSFEDQFRGTREDIKNRLKVYLPYIKKVMQQTGGGEVLDVGCGRGEWLELLKEKGHEAKGVDINRVMVTLSKERGLNVVAIDALDYLNNLPANSLAAVTGFHIIEHLPFKALITLCDASLRVLKPGGIVIFETPNPENLSVGAFSFYCDPTHNRPLIPDTMNFIFEQRGFIEVEIKRLHKYSDYFQVPDTNDFKEKWFYSEMDYAIIGYKQ